MSRNKFQRLYDGPFYYDDPVDLTHQPRDKGGESRYKNPSSLRYYPVHVAALTRKQIEELQNRLIDLLLPKLMKRVAEIEATMVATEIASHNKAIAQHKASLHKVSQSIDSLKARINFNSWVLNTYNFDKTPTTPNADVASQIRGLSRQIELLRTNAATSDSHSLGKSLEEQVQRLDSIAKAFQVPITSLEHPVPGASRACADDANIHATVKALVNQVATQNERLSDLTRKVNSQPSVPIPHEFDRRMAYVEVASRDMLKELENLRISIDAAKQEQAKPDDGTTSAFVVFSCIAFVVGALVGAVIS